MSDKQASRLQMIQQSLPKRVPRIVLQRAEEMLPALREAVVSVLSFCA
jgi:hypothetical protein